MKISMFSYNQLDTFIHRLSGLTKLVCFLLLSFAVMLTYDYRVILFITVLSFICMYIAKITYKQIKVPLMYVAVFLILNIVLSYLLAPSYGCEIYNSCTVWVKFNSFYNINAQTMFYLLVKTMKYFAMVPLGMTFIFTTNPSEFASSLNAIKIPYRICTTLALTLRYFPDIIRDYNNISLAQQARGLELSKKEKLSKRIVLNVKMVMPLIFSTLDRVEIIANAMTLRGYGKSNKRSWYSYRKLLLSDYICVIVSLIILILTMYIRICITKTMFYYPF